MSLLRMYYDPTHQSIHHSLADNQFSTNKNQESYCENKETKIKQFILQNKVIILLDVLKVVLYILAISNSEILQESSTVSLLRWCTFVALIAIVDGLIKLFYIKKSMQQLAQIQRKDQSSLSYLDDNTSSRLIQHSIQNEIIEDMDFVQAIKSLDKETIQRYFQFQFQTTENTIVFIAAIAHVILFIAGIFVMHSSSSLKQTFLYKISCVNLITGFLVICLPLINLFLFLICLPIIIIGSIFSTSQNSDNSVQLKSFVKIVVDEENIQSIFSKKQCSMCLTAYKIGDEVLKLPCNKNHNYHQDCIQKWLKVNSICPDCKQNVKESVIELMTTQRTTYIESELKM